MVNGMMRIVDVFLSSIGLLLFSPILFSICAIMKFLGYKNILFKQERVGKGGRTFLLYKFVTMRPTAHLEGPFVSKSDDPRITSVGKILRKYKLDELPQLINVLKGDMSFVGPRAEVLKYLKTLPSDVREKLLSAKPGITSHVTLLFREEDKILEGETNWEEIYLKKILPQKAQMEIEYIKKKNFFTDMKIFIVTVLVLLKLVKYPKFIRKGDEIILW